MISDWDYLSQAREGNRKSWEILIERHHTVLLKVALLITGSKATAMDIVQDTLVKIQSIKPRHELGNFRAYLCKIVYHSALKEKERCNKHQELGSTQQFANNPDPLEEIILKDRDHYLLQSIHSLDEKHRDILILRFYAGHSYEEISNIVNLPLGTVKSRIFYAVKACKEKLKQNGII